MFDKVDLRIRSGAFFSRHFQPVIDQIKKGNIPKSFHPSRFYRYRADLRDEFGIDAMLHFEYRFGECTHKFEIIDAGKKSLPEIEHIVTLIFDVNPLELGLMRLDLAADVRDIPVSWFRENARVEFKRFSSRIDKAMAEELEFIGINSAASESLYAGRRPNCIRVYNKIAELWMQWHKMKRVYARFNRRMDEELKLGDETTTRFRFTNEQRFYGVRVAPTFEEFCQWEGYGADDVITRVERQIGGDRFPEAIQKLDHLKRLPDFNPFSAMTVPDSAASPRKMPSPETISVRDYLAVMGLDALIKEHGSAQSAYAFVKRYGRGNGRRILDALAQHLPQAIPGITNEELFEVYRSSVSKQLRVPKLLN